MLASSAIVIVIDSAPDDPDTAMKLSPIELPLPLLLRREVLRVGEGIGDTTGDMIGDRTGDTRPSASASDEE